MTEPIVSPYVWKSLHMGRLIHKNLGAGTEDTSQSSAKLVGLGSKGGGTGEARGALAPPILDLRMWTLRANNRLIRSLCLVVWGNGHEEG